MKITFSTSRRKINALTLIETLLTLFVVFIFVAMLAPLSSGPKRSARFAIAKVELSDIVTAINEYEKDYGRFPVPTNVETSALALKEDFTYGGPELDGVIQTGRHTPSNADVIAVLMDIAKLPTGEPTINSNHNLNPHQVKYLNAKMSGNTNDSGVGSDLIYRDPWGHPFIITMDLNGDKTCRDIFYQNQQVSRISGARGFDGLMNLSDTNGMSDAFEYSRRVMVWSFGPDGKADVSKPSNTPPNKDNVLSWR